MPEKIILGIDPGLGRMGFGVVGRAGARIRHLGHGVISTAPGTPAEARLAEIARDLRDLVGKIRPDEARIEKLFFTKNISTGIAVAEARGVARLVLAECGIPTREVSPQEVKIAAVGTGSATKSQVQKMTAAALGLGAVPRPDDAADALGVALC